MPVGAGGLALRDPLNTAARGGLIGDRPVDLGGLPKSVREDLLKTKGGAAARDRDTFEASPRPSPANAPSRSAVSRQRDEEPPPPPPNYPPPSKEYGRETGRPVDR